MESVSRLTDPASPCEKAGVLCGWWSKVAVSASVEASDCPNSGGPAVNSEAFQWLAAVAGLSTLSRPALVAVAHDACLSVSGLAYHLL